MVEKIISGGQTGVDRAALDVAMVCGLACGGWCPHGRIAEDGPIASRYPLHETPSAAYAQRTEWNVRDADGTVVLNRGPLDGGTLQTMECAKHLAKPCMVIDVDHVASVSNVCEWLAQHRIRVLNVAGPRESKQPGIYEQTSAFLRELLSVCRSRGSHPR